MAAASMLKPHAVQQLVLEGNIGGSTAQGRAEADRRVSDLQSRLGSTDIDWHEALDELADVHDDDKISQNTYLQLCDAAKRQHEGNVQPTAGTHEADATSLWQWMGYHGL